MGIAEDHRVVVSVEGCDVSVGVMSLRYHIVGDRYDQEHIQTHQLYDLLLYSRTVLLDNVHKMN